jgi:hypothetical protein
MRSALVVLALCLTGACAFGLFEDGTKLDLNPEFLGKLLGDEGFVKMAQRQVTAF